MKTMIVYFDSTFKNYQVVKPHAQGSEFTSKERFDGNWTALAVHISKGNYYKYILI